MRPKPAAAHDPALPPVAAVPPVPPPGPRASDDPRERLLRTALRLFALQGYARTSTRELAEAAHVNVAAISYYFGDKAGLYRAVCTHAVGAPEADIARFGDPALTLPQVVAGFFEGFLAPLREGEDSTLCMKLVSREMLEPTGLGDATLVAAVRPVHDELAAVLARHLGVADRRDGGVQRLVVGLTALGVHLHSMRFITEQFAPGLYAGPAAIDVWAEHLVRYGVAMVESELRHRAPPLPRRGRRHP